MLTIERRRVLLALLIIAFVVDAALALLTCAIASFVLGAGRLSDGAGWAGIAAWCIVAPVVGFLLRRAGWVGSGVLVALTPSTMVALFLMV